MVEAVTDPNVPPLPPHITLEQDPRDSRYDVAVGRWIGFDPLLEIRAFANRRLERFACQTDAIGARLERLIVGFDRARDVDGSECHRLGRHGTSAARPAQSGRAIQTSRDYHARMPSSIDEVRTYIDRHFAARLTVPRLAARAGLSTFHFIRAFRARTGLTPHQYVRRCRIERAKHLLTTTPQPVGEICDAVGFRSLGSFSRIFRTAVGETPLEWRRRRRRQPYIPMCFLNMYRAEPRRRNFG